MAVRLAKPQSEIAFYSTGLIHEAKGELDEALQNYRAALGVRPNFHDASEAAARVQTKMAGAPVRENHATASLGAPDSRPPPRNNSVPSGSYINGDPDLLNILTAINVQKRLLELGFFSGTTNGTWGQQSRLALARFKTANNLERNDVLDIQTTRPSFWS